MLFNHVTKLCNLLVKCEYILIIGLILTILSFEVNCSFNNTTSVGENGCKSLFIPPRIEGLVTDHTAQVQFNASWLTGGASEPFTVESNDVTIAEVVNVSIAHGLIYTVTVKGVFIGRTYLTFTQSSAAQNTSKASSKPDTVTHSEVPSHQVNQLIYNVAVVRNEGWMDTMFIVAVGLIVVMANVGMGCKIDLDVVVEVIRRPFAPIIGFTCQFLIMPLVAYSVAILLELEGGQALGYFATGCSPGGGASNMYTYILGGDISLSVTMTLVSTVASFGMIPLWLYTLGQHFIDDNTNISIPFHNILVSLAGIIVPVGLGILIQRHRPELAKKLIKCLKPLFIGLIIFLFTIGMWINKYLFGLFTLKLVLAGCLLPYCGFMLSGIAATLCRQPLHRVVTIIIETGIQNTGIPILLMKFSLPQPDADLSVISPVIVAMFTPFPLWVALGIKGIYRCCCKKGDKNNERTGDFQKVSTESDVEDDDDPTLSPVVSDITEVEFTFDMSKQNLHQEMKPFNEKA